MNVIIKTTMNSMKISIIMAKTAMEEEGEKEKETGNTDELLKTSIFVKL